MANFHNPHCFASIRQYRKQGNADWEENHRLEAIGNETIYEESASEWRFFILLGLLLVGWGVCFQREYKDMDT